MNVLKVLIIVFTFFLIPCFSFWANVWQDNLWGFAEGLKHLVQYAYFILWPFMFLAWKFLSNNFIYGSAFSIDNVLWQLWQVVRVFSNYMIWIIFIASIFIYFFKADSKLSWKKMLPRIVISSIVINISWFLIAVLLDISSVLILAAWSIWNVFNNSNPKNNIQDKNIMVPITIDPDSKENFISIQDKSWKEYNACIRDKNEKIVNAPCFSFKDSNFVILDKNGKKDEQLTKNLWITSKKVSWDSLGMLISLFRYMNGSFLEDNTTNTSNSIIVSIIKLILLIVLIVPFIILSIILVIRVVFLWVIIPLSPFILWSYILWIFDSEIKKRFKDIITIIFQPAYVVFMLSIWFIFIQAIHFMIPNNDKKNTLNALWVYDWWTETDWKWNVTQILNLWKWWNFSIQVTHKKKDGTSDNSSDIKNIISYIPWIVANLLSAFVLWSLVFIAFKSNSITKKVSDPIEAYAKTWLKTLPILPRWQSVTSLSKTVWNLREIPQHMANQQYGDLTKTFKKKDDNS